MYVVFSARTSGTAVERVLDKFSKCRMTILLRDFNVKIGKEDIFKLTGNLDLQLPFENFFSVVNM
jgi:hypothetical protein